MTLRDQREIDCETIDRLFEDMEAQAREAGPEDDHLAALMEAYRVAAEFWADRVALRLITDPEYGSIPPAEIAARTRRSLEEFLADIRASRAAQGLQIADVLFEAASTAYWRRLKRFAELPTHNGGSA